MSSRKSSRPSSSSSTRASRKSANNDSSADIEMISKKSGNIFQIMLIVGFVGFVFSVIVQCSVLYYLYNLEDADCNCIRDWRHNFCKVYALLVLGVGIIFLALQQHLCDGFMILYYIVGLINVYAFFTYIGDLNATQCKCAVNKQYNLNTLMRIYRWLLILVGIFTVMNIISMLGFGASKIAASK